jgi:hypothetical protein
MRLTVRSPPTVRGPASAAFIGLVAVISGLLSRGVIDYGGRSPEGSANVLTRGAPPDLLTLDRARPSHRQALDRWAGEALPTAMMIVIAGEWFQLLGELITRLEAPLV